MRDIAIQIGAICLAALFTVVSYPIAVLAFLIMLLILPGNQTLLQRIVYAPMVLVLAPISAFTIAKEWLLGQEEVEEVEYGDL